MRVRRQPVDDELMVEGELVVLIDGQVLVLSEVASEALDNLVTDVWTSIEALSARLEASIGLPPEGESAVFSLVSALEEAGLIAVQQ